MFDPSTNDQNNSSKSKRDIWSKTFGLPAAPTYEEKLEKSRIMQSQGKIDNMEPAQQRSFYLVASIIIAVLALICFIAGTYVSCSADAPELLTLDNISSENTSLSQEPTNNGDEAGFDYEVIEEP